MNILFKKFATYLLILSMLSVPLVSAFGQSFSCVKKPVSSMMLDSQQNMMTNHHCCEEPKKTLCSHCDECDCDNVHSNVNLINVGSHDLILADSAVFDTIIYAFHITDSFAPLYRPPREFSLS